MLTNIKDVKRLPLETLKTMLKTIYSPSMSLRDIICYNAIQNELEARKRGK